MLRLSLYRNSSTSAISNFKGDNASTKRHIPDDVILEIVKYLSSADILIFCLAAKRIHILLVPSLFTSVELRSNRQCQMILKAFESRPELAAFVAKLVVCPNPPSSWAGLDYDRSLKEHEIAVSLEHLAVVGRFKRLHTFKWEGVEAPHDNLWWALKTYCPLLRYIGTKVGIKAQGIDPGSHLFSFRDLHGFSLTTQKCVRWSCESWTYLLKPLLEDQELPVRLWDMLLNHSPDLAELTLDGTCNTYQLWNIRRVLSGRWPRLKSVSFGGLSHHELPSDEEEMTSFLSAHPTLKEIRFMTGMYYSRSSMFYLPALPRLCYFNGRIQQLKLADDLPALQCLELTDWFSPSASFAQMLRFVPTITSLSIYVNFLDSTNRRKCLALYQAVLSACPRLNHFEISATGPIILAHFSQAIQNAPMLRSFVITRTRRLVDEDMNAGALRIANQHPHLQSFTIRDVLDWDHSDQLDGRCRFRQIGNYFLQTDNLQKPHSVRIHETGVNKFGRRYTRSSTSGPRHG
ncbi:hypothetical protein L208DRAFT_1255150 [Tricholoma matsutake]|nr:hypothetical protein L208DRAFT_1255150 [Tricholoma matsutake 945]